VAGEPGRARKHGGLLSSIKGSSPNFLFVHKWLRLAEREGESERQKENGKFVGLSAGSRSGCSEKYVASLLQNAT
jgi:hypothetical protein